MPSRRQPAKDPRTVARDIPGVFDVLFPQLAPGVVVHLNRDAYAIGGCEPISEELVTASGLQHAMLFEIAIAAGEQVLKGCEIEWESCLDVAVKRQRRHFDAKIPNELTDADKEVAIRVANNLASMLDAITKLYGDQLTFSPLIPGYQWIASGSGDFAVGQNLVEVKCTQKRFSASDYRQVVMYWLLSYASSVEGRGHEWSHGILLNPRLNRVVALPFDDIIKVIAAGRSKVDILQLFSSLAGDHAFRMLSSI